MENFIELKKQLTSLEDDLINLESSTFITGDKKEIESIIKENIFLKSAQVYSASKEELAYWEFCSFSVFKSKYQERLNTFLMDNNKNHSNEELFIELELSKYNSLLGNFEKKNYSNEIKPALEKKIAFLNNKLNPNTFIPDVDYSDTKANEKIVFLHELGVLEFLKNNPPFNTSTYSLASVLSAITGENITTIQPYINPIFNKEVIQDKNPLNSVKLTSKVKKKLSDIGYINQKSNF